MESSAYHHHRREWLTLRAALWYHTSCTARPWLHQSFGKRVALEPSPRRGRVWLGSSWPSCERNTQTGKVLMRQGPNARLFIEVGADSNSPTRCPRYPSPLPLPSNPGAGGTAVRLSHLRHASMYVDKVLVSFDHHMLHSHSRTNNG